jgi:hypothetical protein
MVPLPYYDQDKCSEKFENGDLHARQKHNFRYKRHKRHTVSQTQRARSTPPYIPRNCLKTGSCPRRTEHRADPKQAQRPDGAEGGGRLAWKGIEHLAGGRGAGWWCRSIPLHSRAMSESCQRGADPPAFREPFVTGTYSKLVRVVGENIFT